MTGSIERGWRQLTTSPLVPVILLVVGIRVPTDPSRRPTGYGGVLPVPGSVIPASTNGAKSDPLLDQAHRDLRAARGRVLYATGHAPQAATAPRAERKVPCAERRMVQGRANSAPNS
jgi:hypothetical protein